MERIRVSKVIHAPLISFDFCTDIYRWIMFTFTGEVFVSTARCTSCPTTLSSVTCLALLKTHPQMRNRHGRKKYG
jgi:hypothetical protein